MNIQMQVCGIIIILLLFVFYKTQKTLRLYQERLFLIVLRCSLVTLATDIQSLYNDLLLVGFSGAVGMVILYVVIEMPEANRDKQFDCFNSYAFDVYCRDMFHRGRSFSIMEINLIDGDVQDQAFHPIRTPMKIIAFLNQIGGVLVFKNVSYSLIVVSEDPAKLQTVFDRSKAFIEPHGMMHMVEFFMVEDTAEIGNSAELEQLISFCRAQGNDETLAGRLYTVSPEQIQNFRSSLSFAREIREAIREDRVELYLQPVFSMLTNRFDTAEVLARIRTKSGNIMIPNDFIPVAEKDGVIHELGEQILKKVCGFIAGTDLQRLGIRYLAINLSGAQCEHSATANRIIEILQHYHIPPKQIYFETTESSTEQRRSAALETVERLRANGCMISIDRFGKGKSNLAQLMDIPASALKFDYELANSWADNERARQIIRNIVNLAHSLGMKAVAEGVESGDMLEFFQRAGVDYVQGYYFARPMPQKDYVRFMETCI